jgi:transcriptional regulator GlxA family with amidase domain
LITEQLGISPNTVRASIAAQTRHRRPRGLKERVPVTAGAPIGLDELAAQAKLSRHYFCRAFRIATGRTPHDWLTEQRIARAMSAPDPQPTSSDTHTD